jgi:hypothetical protein
MHPSEFSDNAHTAPGLHPETLSLATGKALEVKDQISTILKEYDALSKKEEQINGFMQDVTKVTGLAFVGFCIAAKTDIAGYIGIVCAPVLIVGLLGVVAHCRDISLLMGRQIADVENRIFNLCGSPLLTFHTKRAVSRSRKGSTAWYVGCIVGLLLYVFSLRWILTNIFWPRLFPYSANKVEGQAAQAVLISVAVLIVLYPVRKVFKALAGRRQFNREGSLARELSADGSM